MQKLFGSNNIQWKGNSVGYYSLHEYMRKKIQKPELCQSCNSRPPRDLANKGIYDRNPNSWEYLCRSCHMSKDGRLDNLKKGWHPNIYKFPVLSGAKSTNWKGGISLDSKTYQRNYYLKRKGQSAK